jgi:hypothetical protein
VIRLDLVLDEFTQQQQQVVMVRCILGQSQQLWERALGKN